MIEGAPKLIDFIDGRVARAFRRPAARCSPTRASRYDVNPRLVRGLDYYNRTVFEWVDDERRARRAGHGRRRRPLRRPVRACSAASATPRCGFAHRRRAHDPAARGSGRDRRDGAARLRRARRRATPGCSRAASPSGCATPGIAIVVNAGGGSMKSQMKTRRRERRALRAHHRRRRGAHRTRSRSSRCATGGEQVAGRRARRRRRRSRLAHDDIDRSTQRRNDMAVYDLEEQEQLDDLKAWWQRWGNAVTAVAVVACVAAAGVQGWRWYTAQAGRGGVRAVRRALAGGARATTCPRPRTRRRAARGQVRAHRLRAARRARARQAAVRQRRHRRRASAAPVGDRPRRRGRAEGGRALSPGRGALDDKQYDEALKVLDAKHGDAVRRPVRRPARRRAGRGRARRRSARRVRRRRSPSSTPSRSTSSTCR